MPFDRGVVFEGHFVCVSSVLGPIGFPCVVDQDAPHGRRRHGKEMHPVVPWNISVDQAPEGLMDQGGGLKGVVARSPAM